MLCRASLTLGIPIITEETDGYPGEVGVSGQCRCAAWGHTVDAARPTRPAARRKRRAPAVPLCPQCGVATSRCRPAPPTRLWRRASAAPIQADSVGSLRSCMHAIDAHFFSAWRECAGKRCICAHRAGIPAILWSGYVSTGATEQHATAAASLKAITHHVRAARVALIDVRRHSRCVAMRARRLNQCARVLGLVLSMLCCTAVSSVLVYPP